MSEETKEIVRGKDGKFLKGQVANPKGRPKGSKNAITELKHEIDFYLRSKVDRERLYRAFDKMIEMAEDGSVGAAKLVFDKYLTNAVASEEERDSSPTVKLVIETTEGRKAVQEAEPIEDATYTTIDEEERPDA